MRDVSTRKPSMTVGIDLGDKYSFLCLIDTDSGEAIEEGRLRTTPEALRRRARTQRSERLLAVARKLSVLLHPLWVSGEVYDPLYNAHRCHQKEAA